jgi:hypothetical protein
MKSQNATATIGNVTACSGDTVLVAVDVTNFIDIGAMTFYIGYDTNTSEFLSLQNINAVIPGGITFNATDGQVGIVYSSLNFFTITSGKLFDLKFYFPGDSTSLPFNPGTEIANSNLETIPLDTFTGSINLSLRLINQPDSIQSYPDNDVIFRVTSLGNPDYQWQENTGSGWNDLQNSQVYSGVNNDTLTVHDVSLGFNGYLYRCILTAGNCSETSDIALLEVALAFPAATLGQVNSCPDYNVLEPLFVGDFFDVIEFTFNISYDTSELTFISLQNIYPDLVPGNLTVIPMQNTPGITIHWQYDNSVSITSGNLFDLEFNYQSQDLSVMFGPGSQVINSSFNPVDITLTNGHIDQYPLPVISFQPVNDTVLEGQDGFFSVSAQGATDYIWQMSSDNGISWSYLSDTPPYYNTHTSSLTISPALYNLNGYLFSCRLNNQYCTVYSSQAVLVVDTLTLIDDREMNGGIQIYPNPFHDILYIKSTVDLADGLISIYDSKGVLSFIYNIKRQKGAETDLKINMAGLSEGMYFLKYESIHNGTINIENKKILKTN